MKSLILVPLMVFSLFGCSSDADRILTQAPQTEAELGFLVAGATLEQKNDFFNTHTNVKIRDISNDNVVIFEAVNSDFETLKKNFPDSRIYKNEFIKYNDIQKPTFSLASLKSLNVPFLASSKTWNLQSCRDVKNLKPIAKMTPVSLNLKGKTPLEAGAQVEIDSSLSQPHAFVGGPINVAWVIQAPLGSNVPEVVMDTELNVTLDTMGLYQVYLVVQDQKQNCQFENVNLSVTGNKPFIGAQVNSNLDTKIANQFFVQKLGLANAHSKTTGKGIKIAILDSGVNYNHPYLAPNIYTNPNEIPDNDIDDDKNGVVDDVHGWDFVYNDKYPYDDLGHGTHVSGLAAGKVFGAAPDATIIPVKVGSNIGASDMGSLFRGIIYALKLDADVINLSLGSERPVFQEEITLYKQAIKKDTLIVVAAGNGEPTPMGVFLGVDIDNKSYAPAGIQLENILTVGALSANDNLAYYSNYGVKKVGVATYGGEDFDFKTNRAYNGQMFSTYIENPKGIEFFAAQGTSMATPVATGIAALVRSVNPSLTAGQTASLLEMSGTVTPSLKGKVFSGRILTAESAVDNAIKTIKTLN